RARDPTPSLRSGDYDRRALHGVSYCRESAFGCRVAPRTVDASAARRLRRISSRRMMPRLPHLTRLESLGIRGMKLGLAAIDALCERLGRPEREVESVLVGRANGKRSRSGE